MTLQLRPVVAKPKQIKKVPPPAKIAAPVVTPAEAIDFSLAPSPCFLLDEARLHANLALMAQVQEDAGCSIILALKAFATWSAFPIVGQYLKGATASSLNEALLVHEHLRTGTQGERAPLHVYAPAYVPDELRAMLPLASHVTFNSFDQWQRFKPLVQASGHRVSCGIRVNPEHVEVDVGAYNPCVPGSRLGVTLEHFKPSQLDGIEGLHFHALCESGSEQLERTLAAFEARFGEFLPQMKWVNFGGGHLMTREGYDIPKLVGLIRAFRKRWNVEVILEPGSAAAWRTGWLVATVLDIGENQMPFAILDVSVSAHMPDCLEMPYRPMILGSGLPGEKPFAYRLGGNTCLAGDVAGDYTFDKPLQIGDRLVFDDMIHYTMVKTTFFNGVKHPTIAHRTEDGSVRVVREFGYQDFKGRLG